MGKEIISHFKDKPKSNITWWAMVLGLSLFLVPVATMTLPRYTLGPVNIVPLFLFPLLIAAITTITVAIKKGERSFILWIGIAPVILFALLLILEFTIME